MIKNKMFHCTLSDIFYVEEKYTNQTRVLGGTSVYHCINGALRDASGWRIPLAENNYCSVLERLAELSRDLRK